MNKPKYIIKDGKMFLGHVEFHRDLIPVETTPKRVLGGGWWFHDKDEKSLLLFGSSLDFGHVTKEQILEVVHNDGLPASITGRVNKIYHSMQAMLNPAQQYKELIWESDEQSFEVGERVHYIRDNHLDKPETFENGIVKTLHPDGGKAWVVYNCRGEWENYKDYTGALTDYSNLRKGWV